MFQEISNEQTVMSASAFKIIDALFKAQKWERRFYHHGYTHNIKNPQAITAFTVTPTMMQYSPWPDLVALREQSPSALEDRLHKAADLLRIHDIDCHVLGMHDQGYDGTARLLIDTAQADFAQKIVTLADAPKIRALLESQITDLVSSHIPVNASGEVLDREQAQTTIAQLETVAATLREKFALQAPNMTAKYAARPQVAEIKRA